MNNKQKSKVWEYLRESFLGKPVDGAENIDISRANVAPAEGESVPESEQPPAGIVDIKVSNAPRVGGIIPDIAAGYRENSSSPFRIGNLEQNYLEDGRNKGAAYKFGEFAGTAARLLDNPLVRGGIAYGLSKSMGDRRPLVEGLTAAVGTQQNRMKDQLYRNALEQQGVDTSNIRGFVGDDTFKNYSLSNYRNRNLDVKMHLGTLNDNTKRAQLINTMLNYGELDPVQAMELMNEYGLNVGQLDTSNQTKLLPYRQYAYKNGWNLGWANYGLKADAADLKNQILKDLTGEAGKAQTVRVQSPDGKKGTIPVEQLDGALKAGYKRL